MKSIFKKILGLLLIVLLLTSAYSATVHAKDTNSKVTVILKITAQDTMSGLDEMMLSNYSDFKDGVWEKYSEEKEWTLINSTGENTVYIKVKDKYKNISQPFKAIIDLGNEDVLKGVDISIIKNNENDMLLKISLPKNEYLKEMKFSNDNKAYTEWEKYTTEKEYNYLNAKTGNNSLYVMIKDVDNIVYTKEIVVNKAEIQRVDPTPDVSEIEKPETEVATKASTKITISSSKGIIVSNKTDELLGRILGNQLGIPVKLIGTSALETKNIVNYIDKNTSKKATVYILGLSKDLEGLLKKKGYTKIVRIDGVDKYDTSIKIAKYFTSSKPNGILILPGEKKSLYTEDILKLETQKKYPIIYSKKTTLAKGTKELIQKLKPKTIYLVATENEVSDSVIKEIKKLTKVNVIRLKSRNSIKNIK